LNNNFVLFICCNTARTLLYLEFLLHDCTVSILHLTLCLFDFSFADGDSDEAIVLKLSGAVKQKKASLGGHTSASEIASHSASNRPMILIGG